MEMEGSFIRVKSIDDKLYPYHVRCTNNECQRSTAEKKRDGKTQLHSAKECVHVRFAT